MYIYNYIYMYTTSIQFQSPQKPSTHAQKKHPTLHQNNQCFTKHVSTSKHTKNIHKHTTTISILGAWGAPASFLVTSQSCSWLELLSSGHLRRGCSSRPPSFTVRADANGFDAGWQPGPQPRHKNPTD